MWLLALLASAGVVAQRNYAGRIMGVSVRVVLDDDGQTAHVKLAGAPLLGRVHGSAHFGDDNELVMDKALTTGLRRRGCKVVSVEECVRQEFLHVVVDLPIWGEFRISISRQES